MSIGSFFSKIFGSKAGQSVAAFALTEAQKAVAALKTTPIGAIVASDIAALKNARLTGAQKFELVVTNTMPKVVALVSTPGAVAIEIADVESVTRELVQSIFNDAASSKAATIAQLILTLLGIK